MMMAQTIPPSRWRITPFELIRPRTLDYAITAIDAGAQPLAGGIDLIDAMKRGHSPRALVLLSALSELRRITIDDKHLFLGAGLTHAALCNDAALQRELPDLCQAWSCIANLRIRSRGTLGGNLLAGQPSYEAAVMLSALDAVAVFVNVQGSVRVPLHVALDEAQRPRGLLLGVELPRVARLRLERSLRPELSLAVARLPTGERRIAVGGLGPRPLLAHAATLADMRWPDTTPPHLRPVLPLLVQRILDADAAL
jgi:aerobic carbon-monoxide dehydrogenase medium subunit